MSNEAAGAAQSAPMEQAQGLSVEQRVGKAFNKFMGYEEKPVEKKKAPPAPQNTEEPEPEAEQSSDAPEATSDAPEETQPTAEDIFEFEFEGTNYALPKQLEKAVLNQRDYTQKTQSAAEQRKAAEHAMKRMQADSMRSQFETENAADLQRLAAYDALLNQRPNWEGMDQETMNQTRNQRYIWQEDRNAIAAQLDGKYRQFEQGRTKAIEDLRKNARDLTTQKIPGWNEAVQKAVREHALNDGYTEAELAMAELDPRHNITLWKAQQFDQLRANAKKTVAAVKSVKTTSSNPMPQATKDKLAFNKAIQKTQPGSPEQKRLVEARIGGLFAKK